MGNSEIKEKKTPEFTSEEINQTLNKVFTSNETQNSSASYEPMQSHNEIATDTIRNNIGKTFINKEHTTDTTSFNINDKTNKSRYKNILNNSDVQSITENELENILQNKNYDNLSNTDQDIGNIKSLLKEQIGACGCAKDYVMQTGGNKKDAALLATSYEDESLSPINLLSDTKKNSESSVYKEIQTENYDIKSEDDIDLSDDEDFDVKSSTDDTKSSSLDINLSSESNNEQKNKNVQQKQVYRPPYYSSESSELPSDYKENNEYEEYEESDIYDEELPEFVSSE